MNEPVAFKAETRQLLNILIHSLYTEREVFLRELISNASDALTRASYTMLTNHDVVDPAAELGIWITADAEKHTLTIRDSGIGMTAEELVDNLGTIAHSGASAFLAAADKVDGDNKLSDIIGQFGVGFYSAFMVADSIRVVSRSANKDAQAVAWVSTGNDTYTLEAAEKNERGTEITIQLKDDAEEFSQDYRIRQIIKKHSDYIPYPIYVGEKNEQANKQAAVWRQQPRQVDAKDYVDFYHQMTLDSEAPLTHTHMATDAPVQMYALLYIPASPERTFFSLRKQDGLNLYARKVLIQEYCTDLLPEYLRFVQGVVDSEDLPLNVSRESVSSNRVMSQLKKLVTNKVIDTLKTLGKDKPDEYEKFWNGLRESQKQFLVTDNFELARPAEAYMNPNKIRIPDEIKKNMKILHADILKDDITKAFIERLAIRPVTDDEVKEVVKRHEAIKLDADKWQTLPETERFESTRHLKELWIKGKKFINVDDYKFITLKSKVGEWFEPDSLVFPKKYMPDHELEVLAGEGLIDLPLNYVSETYVEGATNEEIRRWKEFFKVLGVDRYVDKDKKEGGRKEDVVQRVGVLLSLNYEKKQNRNPRELGESEKPGYDILSEANNQEWFIEVKSTSKQSSFDIFLTVNELSALRNHSEKYAIYAVTNALRSPQLHVLRGETLLQLIESEIKITIPYKLWQSNVEHPVE